MAGTISVSLLLVVLVFCCYCTGQARMTGGFSPYVPSANGAQDSRYTAALDAARTYLKNNGHLSSSCANSNIQPSNVEKQVVAGTNYQFSFAIPAHCSSSNGAITCTVVVFYPLPYTKMPPRINENYSPECRPSV